MASPPTALAVTQDSQPPSLFIDFPVDGTEITTATTDVAGRVSDLLSGFMGLTVTVNGMPAIVDVGIGTNGTFFAAGVPLTAGAPTTISATGTDELGNTITKQITVRHVEIPPDAPRMQVVSGNNQTGQVQTVLPEPIVVEMTYADGSPFANKIITFDVTRSDRRLTPDPPAEGEEGSMMLPVRTDADGLARAFWKLGSDAGCGNNRVQAKSTSIAGTVALCASATPAPPRHINIDSGNNQRAEAGGPAGEPLKVWVNDACNGVADVPVTFRVTQGGGLVNGVPEIVVLTDRTGHTEVSFVLGAEPGTNVVEADFADNPTRPAVFTGVGIARNPGQPTSFSGLVLDNANTPIEGATCTLQVAGGTVSWVTTTDSQGQFRFDALTASGPADLFVDGLTATGVGGQPGEQGSFPFLHYEPVIVPNAENALPTPVLLPPLRMRQEITNTIESSPVPYSVGLIV